MKYRPKSLSCNRGVAAVEFAIVAPVFMFLLFGMIAYGVFFGAVHSVQQLAANSARAAMGGFDLEEREELVRDHVTAVLTNDGLLKPENLIVSVNEVEDRADFIKVTISYDATTLPIWNLYNGLPLPEPVIRREAIIRSGGY